MDPKNLDPKLKEAYDRIMGMDLSSSQEQTQPSSLTPPQPASSAPPTPPPQPFSPPTPETQENPSKGASQPISTTPPAPNVPPPPPPLNPTVPETPVAINTSAPKSPEVFQSFNAASQDPQSQTVNPGQEGKPKSKISAPILIFVGLIFFVIYAVLWAKIFGIF